MKLLFKLLGLGLLLFFALQFVRPGVPFSAPTAEVHAPPEIKQILQKNCYACHSTERHLAWFDYPVPAWWLVRHDILTARQHLNFSTLGSKPPAAQKAALYEAVNMIQLGAMPLPSYTSLHPSARVTPEELAALKAYLAPWTPAPDQPAHAASTLGVKTDASPAAVVPAQPLAALDKVPPELNGLPFEPAFATWKPLSFTDRGDNNTFRFILGNDIAIQAANSGNISPWPDGARIAKVAWQQQPGPDGLIHTGKFIQVEIMRKDAQQYKQTDGWGWGRWRGMDLKPYGQNAGFVNECTGCHEPVRGNDYVYTPPITTATSRLQEAVNNSAAILPASLPVHPLDWNAITLFVDPRARTMAVLYGNPTAIGALHARGESPAIPSYPAGSQLALITWTQRDDPHWFGGRIPFQVASVELLTINRGGGAPDYRSYPGASAPAHPPQPGAAAERARFITSLPAAPLP